MEHVEPVGSDYLKFWFPNDPDGYLMKITSRQLYNDAGNLVDNTWAELAYKGADPESYRWFFNPRTRDLEDNYRPLIDFLRTLSTGTDQQLDQNLEKILDAEQFFRVLTARTAHDDWDTLGLGNGQNGYLYFAPIEGRWKLLPWDCDETWGNPNARVLPDADPGTARLVSRPQYRRLHTRLVKEMLDTYWNVPEMSKILDPVYAVVGQETFRADPADIKSFIGARRPVLTDLIPPVVPFRIRTNSGNPFTTNQINATLEGDGWVDIAAMAVNGRPLPVQWIDFSAWRLVVPLDFGANPIDLNAFDHLGNLVGSDQISITSTAGWPAPAVSSIQPARGRTGDQVAITGTSFQSGIRVFFGAVESPGVVFDELVNPASLRAEVAGAAGAALIIVKNLDGRASDPFPFTITAGLPQFSRGDANGDNLLDISDAVRILLHLFRGAALGCEDAADVDDSEEIDLTDAIGLLNFIFLKGAPPPPPYPQPGADPQGTKLGCEN